LIVTESHFSSIFFRKSESIFVKKQNSEFCQSTHKELWRYLRSILQTTCSCWFVHIVENEFRWANGGSWEFLILRFLRRLHYGQRFLAGSQNLINWIQDAFSSFLCQMHLKVKIFVLHGLSFQHKTPFIPGVNLFFLEFQPHSCERINRGRAAWALWLLKEAEWDQGPDHNWSHWGNKSQR